MFIPFEITQAPFQYEALCLELLLLLVDLNSL